MIRALSPIYAIGVAPPGVGGKMTTIASWVQWVAGWGGGLAFVVVGLVFCWAHFGGHGSNKVISALGYSMVGCAIVSAAGVLSAQLLA